MPAFGSPSLRNSFRDCFLSSLALASSAVGYAVVVLVSSADREECYWSVLSLERFVMALP